METILVYFLSWGGGGNKVYYGNVKVANVNTCNLDYRNFNLHSCRI